MLADLRYALRLLVKTPGFTIAAVLTLALAIGGNTAIFSLVNATLLRPLPYENGERLVVLWGNVQRAVVERRGASWPDYLDWRARSRSFDAIAAHWSSSRTLYGGGYGADQPERLQSEDVDPDYFSLLGVKPRLGRMLSAAEEGKPNAPRTAVIGEGLWRRRFNSDPSIVGRSIQLDQNAYTVAGVAPEWFKGQSGEAELWVAATSAILGDQAAERGSRWFTALAKRKSAVSIEQAQKEMDGISRQLEAAYPRTNEKRAVEVVPLRDELYGNVEPALFLLMGAAGAVLLIACANVANLVLARAEKRSREIAIRAALGAGRQRLFRQLIAESLMLSAIGAIAGLLLSQWTAEALAAASPVQLPGFAKPSIDPAVAAFTVAVSLITALVLGLAPALSATASRLSDTLRESSSRSGTSIPRRRFRNALIVAETALALVLMAGAGLFIESFRRLLVFDPGFRTENLLSFRVSLPRLAPAATASGQSTAASPAADARTASAARTIRETLAALPGVRSVALASDMPLSGESSGVFYTVEGAPPTDARTRPRANIHRVTPGFFATAGIRMIHGREFTEQDSDGSTGAVIVSEGVARRFWPGQNPIGKRIGSGGGQWWQVSGVTPEVNYRSLPRNPTPDPDIYLPFNERARGFAVVMHTGVEPSSLVNAVRDRLAGIDRSAVVFNAATMRQRADRQLALQRRLGWLMGMFAAVALALAMIGIYGVISWSVAQRTREIGVRMALGASRGDVLCLVARHGVAMAAAGAGIGLAAAFAVTRLARDLLYGVSPSDPVILVFVLVLILAAALVAAWLPARRATRVDPTVALRYE